MKPWTIALVLALLLPFGQASAGVMNTGYFASVQGDGPGGMYDLADFGKKAEKKKKKKKHKHHGKKKKKKCHSPS